MIKSENEENVKILELHEMVIPMNIFTLPRPLLSECVIDPDNPKGFIHSIVLPDMSAGSGTGHSREQALGDAVIGLMLNRAELGLDPAGEA